MALYWNDSTIDTFPPTIVDVYKAMNKIKAPGVCGIHPEYIQHGGSDAVRTLHKIVTRVWKEEVVPEEWHQGIIIPLYKGKGSKSECSNYRGITLLSVLGKVFALGTCEASIFDSNSNRTSRFEFESDVPIRFESDGPIRKFRIAAPAAFAVVP